jgi:putative heme-binding domain-containing protein
MEPAAGVVPYVVNVNRWIDGARAARWVAIPGEGRIELAARSDSAAVYPEGTVFVEHLTLAEGEGGRPIPLETQILHYELGTWRPYSYLWDDEGRDASLVDPIGASRILGAGRANGGGGERTWHVNATNECKLCHNAGPGFVLGFTRDQLGRPHSDHAREGNQLSDLAAIGAVAPTAALKADDPMRLVDPFDQTQSLDDRARSYLHANCSMCHHPGGNAIVSFYLRRDLSFTELNTNKGTGIGTFGMRDARIIVPGDPYRSVLFYRMSKLGYARMPYIGSQVVDAAGVALVEQWIRSLAHDRAAELSAPATSGSRGARVLQSLVGKTPPRGKNLEEAVAELLKSTEGALALVAQMHCNTLDAQAVRVAVAAGGRATSDIRGLFETFIPESQRKATLGASANPDDILSLKGDRQRGKLIFFSDGARCRACHEIDDRNRSLGPTLREVAKKYPLAPELLRHVLQPSLKIDEPFTAYMVVTVDGRSLSGLLIEDTDREVVIKTPERHLIRIAREDIEEMQKSEKSLMPERTLSDLTAQEAADLFEYIRSQTGGE